jgi:hypothetical protein
VSPDELIAAYRALSRLKRTLQTECEKQMLRDGWTIEILPPRNEREKRREARGCKPRRRFVDPESGRSIGMSDARVVYRGRLARTKACEACGLAAIGLAGKRGHDKGCNAVATRGEKK